MFTEEMQFPDMMNRETLMEFGYTSEEIIDLPDGRSMINYKMIIDLLYKRNLIYCITSQL